MIYLPNHFVGIHIPRTAGLSIAAALRDCFPRAVVEQAAGRHLYGWQLKKRIGEKEWDKLFRFAVIRSPWEIVASDWRLVARDSKFLMSDGELYRNEHWTAEWVRRVQRYAAEPGFDEFVRREYLGPFSGLREGGFWPTWCCDEAGESLGIEPYRYEHLIDDWREIADHCGCPDVRLPRLNTTSGERAPWTPISIDQIGELCRYDVRRFGYQPNKPFNPAGVNSHE